MISITVAALLSAVIAAPVCIAAYVSMLRSRTDADRIDELPPVDISIPARWR